MSDADPRREAAAALWEAARQLMQHERGPGRRTLRAHFAPRRSLAIEDAHGVKLRFTRVLLPKPVREDQDAAAVRPLAEPVWELARAFLHADGREPDTTYFDLDARAMANELSVVVDDEPEGAITIHLAGCNGPVDKRLPWPPAGDRLIAEWRNR